MFQNITQIVFLLMIPNGKGLVAKSKGRRWHYLAAKRLSGMLEEYRINIMIILFYFSFFELPSFL